jgi:uncharacterized protein (TIGR02246 family)
MTPDEAAEFSALRRRVERLEARAEIDELVSAYAVACDEHDMPRLTALFTQDARFTSGGGLMEAEGREAIAAMFVRMFAIRGPAYHWTHDHFVRFGADPDAATGLVLSHAETSPGGVGSLAAMRYEDSYRRVDGVWLFQERDIRFLYYVPLKEYPTVFENLNRVIVGDKRFPADYPESLPHWQAFAAKHNKGGS